MLVEMYDNTERTPRDCIDAVLNPAARVVVYFAVV